MADDDTLLAIGIIGVVIAAATYVYTAVTPGDTTEPGQGQQQGSSGLSPAALLALMSMGQSGSSGGSSGGDQSQQPPDGWGAGDPAEEWHTLTIIGDSSTGDQYEINVSGQAEMGEWAEAPDDSAGNGNITGVIDRGADSYEFTGSVTDLQVPAHAEVSVDDTVIRARNAGSGTRPDSSVPNNVMNPDGDSSPDPAPDDGASGEPEITTIQGYRYEGDEITRFRNWVEGEITTDQFQTLTAPGEGTGAVLNRDELGDPINNEQVDQTTEADRDRTFYDPGLSEYVDDNPYANIGDFYPAGDYTVARDKSRPDLTDWLVLSDDGTVRYYDDEDNAVDYAEGGNGIDGFDSDPEVGDWTGGL